jgi:hypothetical protein
MGTKIAPTPKELEALREDIEARFQRAQDEEERRKSSTEEKAEILFCVALRQLK